MLHIQGLQYSDTVLNKFSESQLADLAGNGLPGFLQKCCQILLDPIETSSLKLPGCLPFALLDLDSPQQWLQQYCWPTSWSLSTPPNRKKKKSWRHQWSCKRFLVAFVNEWFFVRNSDFTSELQDMDMDITLSDGSDSDPDFPTNSNSTQSKKNYEHTMMYAKKSIIYILIYKTSNISFSLKLG